MKKITTLIALALLACTAPAHAAEFLYGEQTKGVTVTAAGSDMTFRVRLQPRLDYGDIIKSKDGKTYTSESDIYFRRARIEFGGDLVSRTIRYKVELSADKWEKAGTATTVSLYNAWALWQGSDAYNIIVGKEKLPYSRVSLTTDSQSLLIEGPVSAEDAKKVFGKTDAYYQPKAGVRGRLLKGIIGYEVAFADGWSSGEVIHAAPARTVYRSGILTVARVELSPPGLAEDKKSDAHLGQGSHLTLGINAARQGGIEYDTAVANKETRTLRGLDLSGHYKGFTMQFEWNEWKIDSTDPGVSGITPRGWYAQAGWFIDSKGLNIEPVGRYESYNQDSHSVGRGEVDTTVGLNWYLKGHSLKAGVNWVHTRYGGNAAGRLANDNSKDVLQVQAQLYL
ncbi:MAG: hypothetical protein HZB85_00035 [Deltaproteobacteria bacterium]|nr:hypothetical protein [Deltaproteobacteria bacterium]